MTEEKQSLTTEYWRKGIHLFSLIIVILYANWFSLTVMLYLLIPALVVSFIIDRLRFYNGPIKRWFDSWFGFMMRPHEINSNDKKFSGATYVLLGAILTLSFFSKPIAIYAFTTLIIGDAFAALVGKSFGKHKVFNLSKTWEGMLAFFITSLIASYFISGLSWQVKLIGAYIATVVEVLPLKIDDNLTIPIISAAVMFFAVVYL